jgi:hypothetical protein
MSDVAGGVAPPGPAFPYRIVGAEWAARMYGPGGPPPNLPGLSGLTRYPCAICGHPTGDCAPEHEEADVPTTRKGPAKPPEPKVDPVVAATAAGEAQREKDLAADEKARKAAANKALKSGEAGTNEAGEVTAGPHEVSQKVSGEGKAPSYGPRSGSGPTPRKKHDEETAEIPPGFVDAPDRDLVVAEDDIYATFLPAYTQTPSRVLLFHKGEVLPRRVIEQRLAYYKDAEGFEIK